MAGVVSLLDDQHYRHTTALWAELEREFGVRGVYVTPFPHFSYHVAEGYDTALLESRLERFARARRPFGVQTAGLGIFTGSRPVLYVPVVRDPALARFHEALWQELHGASTAPQGYYAPSNWVPHITVGFGDLDASNLGAIVAYLSGRDFAWRAPIDNVTLIDASGDEQSIHWRFALGSGERVPPPAAVLPAAESSDGTTPGT